MGDRRRLEDAEEEAMPTDMCESTSMATATRQETGMVEGTFSLLLPFFSVSMFLSLVDEHGAAHHPFDPSPFRTRTRPRLWPRA